MLSRLIKVVLAGSAVLALVALAGCGDDNKKAGPKLTRSAFVTKASAICRRANRKARDFSSTSSTRSQTIGDTVVKTHKIDLARAEENADMELELNEATYEKLKALTPPAALSSRYQKFLDSMGQQIDTTKSTYSKIDAGEDFAKENQKAKRLERQLPRNAAAAGIPACGKSA